MSEMTEWQKQIAYTFAAGVGFAADDRVRKFLVKRGLTASGIGLAAVGTRFAIEGVGLAGSYAIAGKQGMKDWQIASATMFDWGPVSHVPVVGALTSLVPNPIGVGKVLFQSGAKIGAASTQVPQVAWMAAKHYSGRIVEHQSRLFPGRF